MVAILVLGGLSPLGRHVVEDLVNKHPEAKIVVSDRSLPQFAFFRPVHEAVFSKVQYVQANIARREAVLRLFDLYDYDWVINCSEVLTLNQVDEMYDERIYQTAVTIAKICQEKATPVLVQLSTAEGLFPTNEVPSTEEAEFKPFSTCSKHFREMEDELKSMSNLNLVIARRGFVYGNDDYSALTSALVCCDLLKMEGSTIAFPVDGRNMMSTVHIIDVARAMTHLAQWYCESNKKGQVLIYNISDNTCRSPAEILDMFAEVIPGSDIRWIPEDPTLPKADAEALSNSLNEMSLEYWLDTLNHYNVTSTPLSPEIDPVYLSYARFLFNGRKIVQETGFKYIYDDGPTVQCLIDMVQGFKELGVWPPCNPHSMSSKEE
ncbi:MAG: hypothetical protein DHS80DRAFT_24122 [Piptocephalis tieghemiana]|nr:MAG: hypothetical protein DHS80DRAFT_24122 [Piptocephalis tieghemiana]